MYPLPPHSDFVAVAAGREHSLGLRANGSVAAWGNNRLGQCTVPTPNLGFVVIAANSNHSLGLKEDGTVFAWGVEGPGDPPSPNIGFVDIAAGAEHSLGLKNDNTIVAWGSNSYGELNVPAPNADFVAVAAYGHHSLGLKADGTVKAWGQNDHGQVSLPESVVHAIAISAGGLGGMAITTLASPDALTATYQPGRRIELAWNDNSAEESGFYLYRSYPGSLPTLLELPPNLATFMDTGMLPGLEYTYRLAAYDEWRISGYDSATATTNAAPAVVHTPPEGRIGQAVAIHAQVQHDLPIVGVFADYRSGGAEAPLLTVPLAYAASNEQWEVNLPPNTLTESGLQYCLRVTDGIDISRYPSSRGYYSVDAVLSDHPVFLLAGGDRVESYSMLGLPCVASDPDAAAVFDELGAYDPREWRYFRWVPATSGYAEYPSTHAVLPGQGFWITSRDRHPIAIAGLSTSLEGPYSITLGHGWNQIANPFSFDVPFARVTWPNPQGLLHEYTGNLETPYDHHSLHETGALAVGQAYWLWYDGDANGDTLRVYPFADMMQNAGLITAQPVASSSTTVRWSTSVRVTTGTVGDAGYRFGLRSDATDGLDAYDFRAPPPAPGGYANLALLTEDEQSLLTDYRDSACEGACWTLCLRSNQTGSDYSVEFASDTLLPPGWQLRAVDMVNLVEQDLARLGVIGGRIGSNAFERRWRIVAGPQVFVDEARREIVAEYVSNIAEFAILPPGPNPVRAGQVLNVSLAAPRDAHITLRVYDLRGRLVSTIHDGQAKRGLEHFVWQGNDDGGRRAAAGIYILRMRAPGVDISRKVTIVR